VTHDELAADLAAHCRATYSMVWTDMQLGASGSPRPDVYVLPPSYARFDPVAYEVKVSIADARSDWKSGKWQNYYAFATRVYMAAPTGLVKREDLPPGLGLIVRGEHGWKVTKAPQHRRLEGGTLPHETWVKLLLDGPERLVSQRVREREMECRRATWWAESERARQLLGRDVATALQDLVDARSRLENARDRERNFAKELRDRMDRELERAEKDARREAHAADDRCRAAARAAGLPESASWYEVFDELRRRQDALDRDQRILRAARYFRNELARVLPELAEEVA
jgi:hypothetical protein